MSDEDSVPARPNDLEDNPGNVGDAAAGMSFTREQTDRLLVVLVNAHKNTQRIFSNMEQLMRQQGAGNTESMSPATTTASMPINLGTTAGVKAYLHGTQISDRYKNMTLESSNKETFKTLTGSLDSMGYSTLINVPTDGSGLPDANPKRLSSGKEVANIDLKDYFHLVKRFANVSKEHVENWSAFIHGDVNDGLQTVDPRIEKYLDLKAKGNDGLVAQLKHQLRIRCNMLREVLEQALTTAAYVLLLMKRKSLEQGNIKIVDGRRHQWCPNHVAEGAHGFRGLYMFCNSDDGQTHDHSKWLARKQKKKEKKESDGASEATTPATTPSAKKKSTASGGSPTKKRKTVVVNATNLVTTYGMSHANAEQLINDLENSGAGGVDADF